MAQALFLNGASSAGKTTTATALQNLLPEPHLLLGLDTCFGAVPDRWGSTGPDRNRGFAYTDLPPDDGHPMTAITYGEDGWNLLTAFHRGITAIVQSGTSVIIDEMLLDARVREDWLALLAPLDATLVGVYCDLTVDTTVSSPHQCAIRIASYLTL